MAKAGSEGGKKPLTLYEKLIVQSGLHISDFASPQAYKEGLVSWYGDKKHGDDRWSAAPVAVKDWVDEAVRITNKNKEVPKRQRQPLPKIQGLPETDDNAEDEDDMATTSTAKRSTKATTARGGKAKVDRGATKTATKTAKKKGASSGTRATQPLASKFLPAPDDANVSKLIHTPLRAAGFEKQKERSRGGHIVYRHPKGGKEIHVGPGKGEARYLMGWRIQGESDHNYGPAPLEDYLSKQR